MNGAIDVPSPLDIFTSDFKFITGRVPKETETLSQGFKLPEGSTFQIFAVKLVEEK